MSNAQTCFETGLSKLIVNLILPPSSVKVKSACNYTSTPPIRLNVVVFS
jgi:hypothetical protein